MSIVNRILLGYAVACAFSATAAGQAKRPRDARDLFSRGRLHFDLGEYDKAIAEFKQAYRQSPVTDLLFYIGEAYRKKGDCRNAFEAFQKYQRLEPRPTDAAQLQREIDETAQCSGAPTPAPRGVARIVPAEAPAQRPAKKETSDTPAPRTVAPSAAVTSDTPTPRKAPHVAPIPTEMAVPQPPHRATQAEASDAPAPRKAHAAAIPSEVAMAQRPHGATQAEASDTPAPRLVAHAVPAPAPVQASETPARTVTHPTPAPVPSESRTPRAVASATPVQPAGTRAAAGATREAQAEDTEAPGKRTVARAAQAHTLDTPALSPPSPPVDDNPGHALRVSGITTGTLGAAILVGAYVLGQQAQSKADELAARCAKSCPAETFINLDNEGRNLSTAATTLLVVGSGAFLAGTALYYFGWRAQSQVALAPQPGGAIISWNAAF